MMTRLRESWKIIYDFEQIMKEISGLDAVSFQAGGGGQGIYAMRLC